MMTKKNSKVGLTKGKIDWDLVENRAIIGFIDNGLHADVIGERCGGMTRNQVYNRCHKLKKSIRVYRDGLTDEAKVVIAKFSVGTISEHTLRQLSDQLPKHLKR